MVVRTLLNEAVWPAFKALDSYVKPLTEAAVKSFSHDRIATIFRRPTLRDKGVTGPLADLEDLTHRGWNQMRDAIWQYNKELGELGGQHFPMRPKNFPRVEINPLARNPESLGAHEGAHHIYSDAWTPKHKVMWNRVVREYGKPIFSPEELIWKMIPKEQKKELLKLKSHPWLAGDQHYKDQILKNFGQRFNVGIPIKYQDFLANTEALAFTFQDLLTPGREITAPLGMIRGLERIFKAPGLIDRVAHRLPQVKPAPLRMPSTRGTIRGTAGRAEGLPKRRRKTTWERYVEKNYGGPSTLEEPLYPTSIMVKVTWPDGMTHFDEIKGLNQGHALWRAKDNWGTDTSIEVISDKKTQRAIRKKWENEPPVGSDEWWEATRKEADKKLKQMKE
jgi:hypothetical protein